MKKITLFLIMSTSLTYSAEFNPIQSEEVTPYFTSLFDPFLFPPLSETQLIESLIKYNEELILQEHPLHTNILKTSDSMDISTNPKRIFPCSHQDCNKSFFTQRSLSRHRKIHTGKKSYSCPYEDCSKSFFYSSCLTRHEKTHTGEKPYSCPHADCAKSFPDRSKLKKHIMVHTGEKLYSSPHEDCGESFYGKMDFKKHEKAHHSDSFMPSPKSPNIEEEEEEEEEEENSDRQTDDNDNE